MPTSFKKAGLSRGTAGAVAATAVAGAATALWVLHRARKAERDNPPLGRFIEVDGIRLHFIDKGKGPVVVLLHGNAVQLQDFIGCGLIDRLAEHHRVIAFDRPGFGHSLRPRDRLWTAQAQAAVIRQTLVQIEAARRGGAFVGHVGRTRPGNRISDGGTGPRADFRLLLSFGPHGCRAGDTGGASCVRRCVALYGFAANQSRHATAQRGGDVRASADGRQVFGCRAP
jgi:hypothetical protein